jgi:hypothetical protein
MFAAYVSTNAGDNADGDPGIDEYRALFYVRLDIGMNLRCYERGFTPRDPLRLEPFLRHVRGKGTA